MKKLYSSLLFIILSALFLSATCLYSSAADIPAPVITNEKTTANSVSLQWKKIKGADGYRISKRKKGAEKFEFHANTKNNYCTVDELSAGKTYEFTVRAYIKKPDGKKNFGETSKTLVKKTKLSTPKGLAFSSATEKSITLKWKTVKGAEKYNIYCGISGEDGYTLAGTSETVSFTIKGLNAGTRYKIKVKAIAKGNSSDRSELIRLYTLPKRAAKPSVSSADGASVTIKWEKNGNANLFNIYVASSEKGKFKKVASTKKTTYTYKKETPEKAYYFKIVPVIKTDYQTSIGKASKIKKASIGKITIELPDIIRKGEYPEINVPYYGSEIKWSSSDKSVLKIKNGRVLAANKGTATLTATYKKKYKASVKVTVTSPTVNCMSAVYDVKKKEYIYHSGLNNRCYPASITKLVTALVALKYMDESDTIVVGNELNMLEAYSSRCDLVRGEKYKLKDILYGLLLPSGGDAAYTIAVNCARSVSGNKNMNYVEAKNYFVRLMNKYMDSIGATGSNFINPHGYPVNGHYSTVHDLVLVAEKVLQNKTLKKITSTSYKTITPISGNKHKWGTTNSLISSGAYYYSPYAHGMKTGTVSDDYTCIIGAATKDEKTIITVVVGCNSYNARYDSTHKLLNTYL